MPIVFDHTTLNDPAARDQYARFIKRGAALSRAVASSYGKGRAPIEVRYVLERYFNATVSRETGHYSIDIASPVPYFLLILHSKLFADERVLPWLAHDGQLVSDYKIEFVTDPADPNQAQPWSLQLNAIRAFAARMVADITATFILAHEFGHILCGHLDALEALEGKTAYHELSAFDGGEISTIQRDRYQCWEHDADAVGASLTMRYVAELLEDIKTNSRTNEVFAEGEHPLEQILAIVASSLFAVFSYVRGTRYELDLNTSHPHPFVRAFYVKDMLVRAASDIWPVNIDIVSELMEERIDEVLIALEAVDLSNNAHFTDVYMNDLEAWRTHLTEVQFVHREACQKWSWIEWG